MQEIHLKKNDAGLNVLINDYPKFDNIPPDVLNLLISSIDNQLTIFLEKKRQKKPKKVPPWQFKYKIDIKQILISKNFIVILKRGG